MRGIPLRAAALAVSPLRRGWARLLNLVDRPVVILIYHRVTTLSADPQLLAVSPANFRAQLQHLKDRFPIVRLEDDWSRVDRPAVAITFDDGYADNALEALPILEEVGAPATFFVTTGAVGGSEEFWWDELGRILLGDWAFPPAFRLDDERHGRSWLTTSRGGRETLYRELHPLMKRVDAMRRDRWIEQLRRWAGAGDVGRTANRALTVDELRRLAASRWATVGAHTVTHAPLSSLPRAAQRDEMVSSKAQLEAWIGREVKVFSYPFGTRRDFTRVSRDLCKQAKYEKAVANYPGQAHAWTDAFRLPRQLVRNWTVDVFGERLQEFFER